MKVFANKLVPVRIFDVLKIHLDLYFKLGPVRTELVKGKKIVFQQKRFFEYEQAPNFQGRNFVFQQNVLHSNDDQVHVYFRDIVI